MSRIENNGVWKWE